MAETDRVDIVTEADETTGTAIRADAHRDGLLHRAVHVWFVTPDRKIIFQRRSRTKETYPDLLDATVGGHVDAGDDWLGTAVRETAEETGVTVKADELRLVDQFPVELRHPERNLHIREIHREYAYLFTGAIADLKIEAGKAEGFEAWHIDDLAGLTAKQREAFIFGLIGDPFPDMLNRIVDYARRPATPRLSAVSKLAHYLASDPVFRDVYDYTRKRFEAAPHLTAHNFEHARRDVLNAIIIGEAEGADMHIVLCAAVMHDIGYLYGGTGRTHGELGADQLDDYLKDSHVNFPAAELEHIRACIRTHKGSVHQVVPDTLEAQVVSDADMLEKIGPMGTYQFIRSLTEFNFDTERVIERLAGADQRRLVTKTGNAMAAERRGFATDFAKALNEAHELYRETQPGSSIHTAWPLTVQVVVGAVLVKDGKYLLVQQKKASAYGLWGLPAGRANNGESLREAVIREVKEETSYEVSIGEQINVEHPADGAPVFHAFEAAIAGGTLQFPADEILDAKWYSYEDVQRLHRAKQLRVEWVMHSIYQHRNKEKGTTK